MAVLSAFPEYLAFRTPKATPDADGQAPPVEGLAVSELSPSEAAGELVRVADAAVAGELLERVLALPPVFLERLSLRLLRAMGYGGRESLTEHTGKPGDAGSTGSYGKTRSVQNSSAYRPSGMTRRRQSIVRRFRRSSALSRALRRAEVCS